MEGTSLSAGRIVNSRGKFRIDTDVGNGTQPSAILDSLEN